MKTSSIGMQPKLFLILLVPLLGGCAFPEHCPDDKPSTFDTTFEPRQDNKDLWCHRGLYYDCSRCGLDIPPIAADNPVECYPACCEIPNTFMCRLKAASKALWLLPAPIPGGALLTGLFGPGSKAAAGLALKEAAQVESKLVDPTPPKNKSDSQTSAAPSSDTGTNERVWVLRDPQ